MKEDGTNLIEINVLGEEATETEGRGINDDTPTEIGILDRPYQTISKAAPTVSRIACQPASHNSTSSTRTIRPDDSNRLISRAGNSVNVVFQPINQAVRLQSNSEPQRSHIWEREEDASFPVKYIQSQSSTNQLYQNPPSQYNNPTPIRVPGQIAREGHLFRPPRPKDERTILQRR